MSCNPTALLIRQVGSKAGRKDDSSECSECNTGYSHC